MDSKKFEALLSDNLKSIFGFSLTRLGNVHKAEELASDILYKLVRSAPSLKDEDRFYGFMWKIAENTYYDYLRKCSRVQSSFCELDDHITDSSESVIDSIVKSENINLLRRELSLLSETYRKATVLHYMDHYSCSEIAEKLQISTEMIKYYLFRARKIIREGMNMERLFGERSYRPGRFEIDFWGTNAGDDKEYKEFEQRKIRGNILLAAYYAPVTIQEISLELGVAVPYLEDEVKLLMERMYLVCKNGKYTPNIPIFTLECTKEIIDAIGFLTEATAAKLTEVRDSFIDRYGDRFTNENHIRWQKMFLSMIFALKATDNLLTESYGELPKDGPYSLVNGGGGRGIVWGRSCDTEDKNISLNSVQGIYCNCTSQDGRGSVSAINFAQTLNIQHFETDLTTPLVCTAVNCFEYLPSEWKCELENLGYVKNGGANFPVYTKEEYELMPTILKDSVETISELIHRTMEVAAKITADLAPSHIKKNAEYAGALVYRFTACEKLIDTLYHAGWLKTVDDSFKPNMCVVRA